MLFNGLMTQSKISQLLDELFDDLEEVFLGEAEDTSATFREEVERESSEHATLLAV